MTLVARITDRHLLSTIAAFPAAVRDDPTNRSFYLSLAIVKHFLGEKWIGDHIEDTGRPGYLRLDWSDREQIQRQSFRIVDLAELFFNLQYVEGFDGSIKRMESGDVEGTYAELDLGRMLYENANDFRFVSTSGNKGDDFDIEITFDGMTICADAKCKVEATEFSKNTIKNSLAHARSQFPGNRPSIIFVKIPPRWLEGRAEMKEVLTEVSNEFLRNTGRVVSIKFYISYIHWANCYVTHVHAFHEINNRHNGNRFDPSRNWDMFRDEQGGVGPNKDGEFTTVPARWRRLMHYPEGMQA